MRPVVPTLIAIALVCLSAPVRAGDLLSDRLRVGRGPDVFRPDEDVWTARIGGWFDASYEDNDLSSSSQSSSSQSVNLNHLNVFVDARYRETWQVFVEAEFEHETGLYGYEAESEYELEQAYLRYRQSDALELRVGKFNTPFGYWTPVHWSILMDTIRPPLHEGLHIITPEQQNGVSLSGHWIPEQLLGGELELRYTGFVGYGNDSDLLDETRIAGWAGGVDLRGLLREDRYIGVSYYQQQRDIEPHDRSERSFVVYGETALPANLTLRGEYVKQLRDRHARPSFKRDIDETYVKLRWRFDPRAYLNYRFNWGDDESTGTGVVRRVHTFTLGVEPMESVRLKFEYAEHDFRASEREDFRYWGVSVGALF